jgi:hypothetical protein
MIRGSASGAGITLIRRFATSNWQVRDEPDSGHRYGKIEPNDPVQTFLPDRDLSGCRYVQIIQIGPDPVFPRMAIERLKNCSASGIATLILVETGQVLQNVREIRMVRTERLLEGCHRPLEKPLGIGVTPLTRVKRG